MIDVASFHAGDEASFRELVRSESGRLLAIIRRYARDDSEADDLLQQSWLAIYRSRRQFDGRGSLAGWTMAVCRNVCLAHARKRAAAPVLVPIPAGIRAREDAASAEMRGGIAEAVTDAIAELPRRERDVAMLRLVEGLSTREAAVRLGCAEGTVKATLHRASAKLREILREYR